jgi:hypothetical protein
MFLDFPTHRAILMRHTSRGTIEGEEHTVCRSIKTLRPPYHDQPSKDDFEAAALQYVRKISGFRQPSKANQRAFEKAVRDIARISGKLLSEIEVAGAARVAG